MPHYILGIDGGQTSTKHLVATLDGQIAWCRLGAPAFRRRTEDFRADVEQSLAQILQRTLSTDGWESITYEAVVLGMSGAEPGSPMIAAFRRAAERAVQAKRYIVIHDVVSNLLGASAGQPGIVVIGGGGAVAHGLTADGRSWTAGGWGYIIGDEGSGYNVGRAAINAVFRAIDRRDPPTRLTDAVFARLGVPNPVELKYAIFEGGIPFQDIADLPMIVARTALEGDATARLVLEDAGRDLAESAVAVARALDIDADPVDIYPTGGLFQESHFLVPAFQAAVSAALPEARICQPAFEPVVGTLFRAFRELGQTVDETVLKRLRASWAQVSWEN